MKKNKWLWISRGILLAAFAIITYFGIFVNDRHIDAVISIVLFTLLILMCFFALSFLLPIISAVFYILISSFFVFILSLGSPSGSSDFEIFGIDALLVYMWMILIASILLIFFNFLPHLGHFLKEFFIGNSYEDKEVQT
jgi:hypothetical protein